MRWRNLSVAVVAMLGITATPAAAATGPEPWQPYRASDFVSPAGRSCDFDLGVSAVEDEEEYRVTSRYPDGNVREYEFRGTLVSRFTNLATGESTVRDLSGHAWQGMYPDGVTMRSFTGVGPFGFGFREVDTYPRGYYRLDGLHRIELDLDGTRHLRVSAGPTEDLCQTLG